MTMAENLIRRPARRALDRRRRRGDSEWRAGSFNGLESAMTSSTPPTTGPLSPTPLAAAKACHALGWSVIPIEPGGKRPLVRWERFQHKPSTDLEILSWFSRWPGANLGIVTGAVSSLVVLDVDPRHNGNQSLEDLCREHGALPDTVEAQTGGGGRHLYFRHPGTVVHNRTALAPGLDLRGDGGMVVAPPSLHASGRHYCWRAGHGPDRMAPAPMPDWLHRLGHADSQHSGHPLTHWRHLVRDGVGEGARNNAIASMSGHLLFHGVDPEVVLELMLCWNRVRCRPPLPDEEVANTVDSIARTHIRHRETGEGG